MTTKKNRDRRHCGSLHGWYPIPKTPSQFDGVD